MTWRALTRSSAYMAVAVRIGTVASGDGGAGVVNIILLGIFFILAFVLAIVVFAVIVVFAAFRIPLITMLGEHLVGGSFGRRVLVFLTAIARVRISALLDDNK